MSNTTRAHLALATTDLEASAAFFSALFGQAPTKRRPDYVKFSVEDPPLNLTLNPAPTVPERAAPEHFGVEVPTRAALAALTDRVRSAGHLGHAEIGVTCCYSVQDKVWLADPDGRRWEIFVVVEADAEVHSAPAQTGAPECCA